jgi:hypothetical protein
MGEALERSALDRWRADPTAFIRDVLRDPETGRPFELFDAQRQFLGPAFTRKLTDASCIRSKCSVRSRRPASR